MLSVIEISRDAILQTRIMYFVEHSRVDGYLNVHVQIKRARVSYILY